MTDYIVNKAWEDARYELCWMKGETFMKEHWPCRFNEPPPPEVWTSNDLFYKWLNEHQIPRFIAIEDQPVVNASTETTSSS